ncbi:MAG: DPP IV N-terminal domain-containing protein [Candidatus Poribacteria bacterium]|nr:DPP IV N-terminal domain-containing protein [Candidatus Poribacteria bacterium]
MNDDGSGVQRLTDHPDHDIQPKWSSAADRIAFTRWSDGLQLEVYTVDQNGANPVNLTEHPAKDWDPAWSPDGEQIVFRTGRDGVSCLYSMNADGTNVRRLTFGTDWLPSWSPDGQQIAFVHDSNVGWDVYTLNIRNGNRTRLTDTRGNIRVDTWSPPSWSPNSGRLVFSAWTQMQGGVSL